MQDKNCHKCGTNIDFDYCRTCDLVVPKNYTVLSEIDHLLKEDSIVTISLGNEDIVASVSFDGQTVEGHSIYVEDALANLENILGGHNAGQD